MTGTFTWQSCLMSLGNVGGVTDKFTHDGVLPCPRQARGMVCRAQGGYNLWDACFSIRLFSLFLSLAPLPPFSLSLNIRGRSPVVESATSNCNNLIRSRSYLPRTLFASRLFFVGTCNAIFLLAFLCLPIISRVEWTGVPPTSPEVNLLWISDADRTHTGINWHKTSASSYLQWFHLQ